MSLYLFQNIFLINSHVHHLLQLLKHDKPRTFQTIFDINSYLATTFPSFEPEPVHPLCNLHKTKYF